MTLDEILGNLRQQLNVSANGEAQAEMMRALYERVTRKQDLPAAFKDPVDERSERNIATLLPEVQPYARALVRMAGDLGITIKVLSGTRTFEEQEKLFAQGRTAPGNKVTNARGGESNHNYGIAFDVGVFEGPKYLGNSPLYASVGNLGVALGLEWGGNWKTIKDQPHFQLRPQWAGTMPERQMLGTMRERLAAGAPFFA